jgi:hypothetical protein
MVKPGFVGKSAIGVWKIKKECRKVRFLPWGREGRGFVVTFYGEETPPYHLTSSRTPPRGGNYYIY